MAVAGDGVAGPGPLVLAGRARELGEDRFDLPRVEEGHDALDDGNEHVVHVGGVLAEDGFGVLVDFAASVGGLVAYEVGDGGEGADALVAVSGEQAHGLVGVVPHVFGDGAGGPCGEGAGFVEDADDGCHAGDGFPVEAVSVSGGVEGECFGGRRHVCVPPILSVSP